MASLLKFRRGLKANIPALQFGEPGFAKDEGEVYIGGDGTGNVQVTRNKIVDDLTVDYAAHKADTTAQLITKAPQTALDATNAAVALKAPQSALEATTTRVTALETSQTNVKVFKGSDTTANIQAKTGMTAGDYWYSTDGKTYLCYNGSAWVDIGTDNAELIGVRTGADGTAYASAGEAVRGQANKLLSGLNLNDLATRDVQVLTDCLKTTFGYFNPIDKAFSSVGNYYYVAVKTSDGEKFHFTGTGNKYCPCIVFFNGTPSAETYMSYYGNWTETSVAIDVDISIPAGCTDVVFQFDGGTGFTLKRFAMHDGIVNSMADNLLYAGVKQTFQLGYWNPVDNAFSTTGAVYYTSINVSNIKKINYRSQGNNQYAPAIVYFKGDSSSSNYLSCHGITSNIIDGVSYVPEEAVIAYLQTDTGKAFKFETFAIDNKTKKKITYSVADGVITIKSKYNSYGDLIVTFGKWGVNQLPDFLTIYGGGYPLSTTLSDWHSPFIVGAVNNINGDHPSFDTYFTGGGHTYDNTTGTVPSASNEYLHYRADDEIVDNGMSGSCDKLTITWSNLVQGYNTEKADGTGRAIIREIHKLTFDGANWVSSVDLVPLEDVYCKSWYAFQVVSTNNGQWGNLKYIGATNRGVYAGTEDSECGGNFANMLKGYGASHEINMELDTNYDLGKGDFYAGTNRLFNANYGKAYFYLIKEKTLHNGETYSARCIYRFIPAN